MSLVRRPRPATAGVALVPGVLAVVLLLAAGTPVAGVLALVGVAVAGVGAGVGSRAGVTLGGFAGFCGVVAAAVGGGSPGVVVLAAAGVVTAWTTGQHVVGLAHQLGREAPVRRSVLGHLATATVATVTAGVAALVVYRVAAGSVRPAALAFLLVGVAALLYALR